MYLVVNIIGVFVFLAIGFLCSKDRQAIKWRSIGIMLVINLVIAWFLTSFSVGRTLVGGASNLFNGLVQVAYQGIAFALPDWVAAKPMNFVTSALLPILMIIPLFDILTYIGVLPWIIKWIGKGLSVVTGQPKFESFFAVEMMFLGNTEALAISSLQLKQMKPARDLTLAMMSMSCVTASIIGSYTSLMPGQFVLTAIPINIMNAILITNMLNPVTVTSAEDIIVKLTDQDARAEDIGSGSEAFAQEVTREDQTTGKEPFFSFLGDSIINAGKLILIITANVIAFVALAALVDKLLGLVNPWLSLEHILGIVMFPFAWLLGLDNGTAFQFAQYMGTKLVTNEFVVMGKVTEIVNTFAPHYKAVLTVFLTSFANFSTIGMIIGCFKGLVNREKNELIARNVGYLLLSGILVSLLSAAIVGLFVW